ncbi:MAG TPA: aldehyde dehydrogenase family protein [Nocardioides sp.]|jgi:succinate-semialdehyde dehydrogenase/glutarate-semialdehyde dehydrogenase|uniref:aldehyde dehydrogenase family protein n=1 Tax=Nocardioides sp. TaxID=35761 RepID=UPI002E33894A|nr:aldehyde dehydrogenase family protein [Nocardioides sp.]HEX3931799.1 aldehyde dehydrogenase family protein [Nocardioides sp.]
MRTISTVSPSTGAPLESYPVTDEGDIDALLDDAVRAQAAWRRTPLKDRLAIVGEVARLLDTRRDQLAALAVAEMGKPLDQAREEVQKCATVCAHVVEHAEQALADESVTTPTRQGTVVYEPLGVALAVMPWNYPFWQVVRFGIPALAAGNAIVLKHAPNVTGAALALVRLFSDAGFPPGLFTVLVVDPRETSEIVTGLIGDPRIAAVTFTGSNATGARIAKTAGAALKKSVLELGGSDPFVVLDDAELDSVVPTAVSARMANTGQSCLAAKRFIVDERLAEEFCERYVAEMDLWKLADPALEGTRLGPLARPDLADTIRSQVERSAAQGGRVRRSRQPSPTGPAWCVPAVVLDATPGMAVMAEETFGPVAAVATFRKEADAVMLANATVYGLGASVWSSDPNRALELGSQIVSGSLFVNAVVASDAYLPLGGVKDSGYGRELGVAGLREMVNVRSVVVQAP